MIVLSVGAGKMASLVLQGFAQLAPKRLMVTNRSPAPCSANAGRSRTTVVTGPSWARGELVAIAVHCARALVAWGRMQAVSDLNTILSPFLPHSANAVDTVLGRTLDVGSQRVLGTMLGGSAGAGSSANLSQANAVTSLGNFTANVRITGTLAQVNDALEPLIYAKRKLTMGILLAITAFLFEAGVLNAVTQTIAWSVKGDTAECSINGAVVASFKKADLVGDGKLASLDGIYGIRVSHNLELTVSGLTKTP